MDCKKYIGMDVHQASISIAVRDATGKVVAESVIETKAATILAFIRGIQGSCVCHIHLVIAVDRDGVNVRGNGCDGTPDCVYPPNRSKTARSGRAPHCIATPDG